LLAHADGQLLLIDVKSGAATRIASPFWADQFTSCVFAGV